MNEFMMAGIELMLTGMGIVFLFLVMLIGAVKLMAYCVAKFFPEELPATAVSTPTPVSSGVTPTVTAAITAAVHQHRTK